jgi:uncharacterized protein (TIGR02271 family)
MPPMNEVLEWCGQTMVGSGGDKIGKIEEIYVDNETEQPEWALVHTGMLGSQATFVPIANATTHGDEVQVPFDTAEIKDAPKVDADGELSQPDAAALYSHYGLEYAESGSDSGLPADSTNGDSVGNDVGGRETDAAMTRSEEELRVGTTQRETGRARLRKYIVTENVTRTVPVQREEVRVEREPITDANRDAATSGAELSEDEHEVVLHEEQVVVEKTAVPKERVRLDKDTVTEQRSVSEQIRKEQIEHIDADGEPAAGQDDVPRTDEVAR